MSEFNTQPIAHECGEPYPTIPPHDEHGPRFGILKAQFALMGEKDEYGNLDPYGVTIEYYDKKTKQQGSVKLLHSLVRPDLWPRLNEAINAIVIDSLERINA